MSAGTGEGAIVGLYARVAWYAFRRHAAYRTATAAAAFTNTVFGFLRAYVLIALWQARPDLGGYAVMDAVTFCFITQALIGPAAIFGPSLELTERIRSGDIAIDLYRPVDFQAWWLADDLGRAAFMVVFRGGPPLLAGALAFPLTLPDPLTWMAFAASAVLAMLTSFALRYLVAVSAFWTHDDRGVYTISLIATMFFSGMILPLVIFPGWLGTLAQALPWSALIQVPADVFLGKSTGGDLFAAYVFQAGWAMALLALGRVLTVAARRRLVIQGG